jgi:glycerol-3-phosphate cytidylyltransferase
MSSQLKTVIHVLNGRKENKPLKVGITFSTFDLLHAGHIGMLREAKGNCDYLIVGLQVDPTVDRPDTKNKPVQTLVERYEQLNAIKFIDEIVPYETEQDLMDILELFELDIRFLGEEYREKEFTGKDLCRKRGIELFFNKREHRFSTTDLRKRIQKMETNNGRM